MFKRCLGLLLAIALILSAFPVGAAFSDVPEDLSQGEAIEVLSGLGLIAGYDEGGKKLFKPEGKITRAEFTAMLTRALKMAQIGAVATTPFDDVADDHWASANIRVAYDMGIIAGYDAKTFGPEDNVTYEQAVKMMVCALGFGNVALSRGGYPTGYLNVAYEKKIMNKISGSGANPATRGDIAQMIYNSFNVAIAIEDGFNPDGTPNYITERGRTLLTEKLELNVMEGLVTGNRMTRLDNADGVAKKGFIEIEDELYAIGEEYDQNALLGRLVEIYYSTDEITGTKTIAYLRLPAKKNVSITLKPEDIEGISDTELVYTDKNGDSETLEYSGLKVIYNKKYADGKPSSLLDIKNGSVTLLDADNDDDFDVAFVSEYEVVHVNKVDTVNYVVTDYNTGARVTVKPMNESSADRLLLYKDGVEVPFNTIRNRTTLCIYKSKNAEGYKLTEVVIVQKTARGKIEKIKDGTYTIAGKEYGSSYYLNDTLSLGQESTFYLDVEGKIVDIAAVALAGAKLYGYLVDVRFNEGTEKLTLRLIPAGEEEVKSYECSETTVLDGVQVKDHRLIQEQLATAALETNKDSGAKNAEYSQLIFYGLSKEKITAINTLIEGGAETNTTNLTPFSSLGEYTGKYLASKKKFDFNSGITIGASTKIFVVPSDRKQYSEYTAAITLKDGKEYTVEAFEKSTVGIAGAVVIYGGASIDEIAVDAPLYLVTAELESMINENDESILRIPAMNVQSGAESVFDISAEDAVAPTLLKGDIIRFATDSKGAIRKNKLELLFSPNGALPPLDERERSDTDAFKVRYGTLYSADTSGKQILFTHIFPEEGSSAEARDLYSYSGAKIFVYDTTAEEEENRIIKHNTSASNIAYAQTIYQVPAGTRPSTAFLHISSGKVKFIYIVR